MITNSAPTDRNGDPLANLSRYRVDINVIDSAFTLGNPALDADSGQVARIEVTVSHPGLETPISMSTHRANAQ